MFAYKRIFLRFFLIIVFMFSMNAYCIDVHAFRDACRSVKLAPEFHFDEQFIEYFNNKNDDFEKRYFLNNSVFLEAAFFSINNRSFFFGNVTTNFGMGRQGGAILLDPRDIDMAFGPMYEYRTPAITCRAGLDHHCFHQIDNVEWNTLYWNKLYIEAGSNDLRKNSYRERLSRSKTGWQQRLSWQIGYGYFVHDFFGIMDTSALSWGNAYIHETSGALDFAFLRTNALAVYAGIKNRARIDKRGAWLWTEEMSCEAMTLKGAFGMSAFVNWVIVDQSIIRENKDKLVEVGVSVFR
ncbi:MAG TPA: hypothetical protein DCO75_03875 [Fibrobacteres bacterium]|nr:hypothetical protein [Fibrobacterota bacterium]